MKEKMYSFIAHPVNNSRLGEYIEHSITEKYNISLEEMLESYARFLSAIGYDLDGRELMLVDDEADTMSFDPQWGKEYLKDGANVNSNVDDPRWPTDELMTLEVPPLSTGAISDAAVTSTSPSSLSEPQYTDGIWKDSVGSTPSRSESDPNDF